ncbi:MAG TPA: chemotaxis protein CheA [Longimicrobiales bacterium]|nr:chemotaxis protein CheA [Longimicrobiales bacterium]
MDLRRFVDLYVSESREHVQLLQRSLLALEKQPAGPAVDQAFRAAHTLKGLAAAMGYGSVTELAHHLEDRLEEVRAGRLVPEPDLVDAMLADADRLEAAIAEALTRPPGEPAGRTDPSAPSSGPNTRTPAAVPDGTGIVAVIRLRPDAPIKSARAMIIMRGLESVGTVLGSHPPAFDDDFDGGLHVFLGHPVDGDAVRNVISGAGDVDSIALLDPNELVQAAAPVAEPAVSPPPPSRQVRVDAHRLDRAGEDVTELAVLFSRIEAGLPRHGPADDAMSRMGRVLASLQRDMLQLRMVPLADSLDRLHRVVRDAARATGRDVALHIDGDDVELDRAIVDEMGDCFVHLLRNAVDHGIEPSAERVAADKPATGCIRIAATPERSSVRITVSDDGRGVDGRKVMTRARAAGLLPEGGTDDLDDAAVFRLLSHPGLSTADEVSAVSGRGVGMDVVVSRIRSLGGAIDMMTEAGAGTTFIIRLPVTLAMSHALRVRVGREEYAIPLTHVVEAVDLNGTVDAARDKVWLRDAAVPLVRLRDVLQVEGEGREETAVIAVRGDRKVALAVDELVGREQIQVRSFDDVTGTLPYFTGAILLADGRPALVLDPLSVM